jgi:hypothetical protein
MSELSFTHINTEPGVLACTVQRMKILENCAGN